MHIFEVGKTMRMLSESRDKLTVSADDGKTLSGSSSSPPKRFGKAMLFYGHLSMASFFVKPHVVVSFVLGCYYLVS